MAQALCTGPMIDSISSLECHVFVENSSGYQEKLTYFISSCLYFWSDEIM